MIYKGQCHCGEVAFEVDGELSAVVSCNCSICSRKGALLWAVPRKSLGLLTPESNAGSYLFNQRRIAHRFCRTCGLHPFAEDVGEAEDRSAYINVRCLENADPASLDIIEFDGRNVL